MNLCSRAELRWVGGGGGGGAGGVGGCNRCNSAKLQKEVERLFRPMKEAPKTAAQTKLSGTDLWWIGHIPIFRHACIDIHVSGGFAVKAGVDSWVVIPLIPKEAFPFHLASLDIDPGADAQSLSGHGMQDDSWLKCFSHRMGVPHRGSPVPPLASPTKCMRI